MNINLLSFFCRHAMPDFLPDTKYRDSVMEALERVDMYMRRSQIEIPEFYVGNVSGPCFLSITICFNVIALFLGSFFSSLVVMRVACNCLFINSLGLDS